MCSIGCISWTIFLITLNLVKVVTSDFFCNFDKGNACGIEASVDTTNLYNFTNCCHPKKTHTGQGKYLALLLGKIPDKSVNLYTPWETGKPGLKCVHFYYASSLGDYGLRLKFSVYFEEPDGRKHYVTSVSAGIYNIGWIMRKRGSYIRSSRYRVLIEIELTGSLGYGDYMAFDEIGLFDGGCYDTCYNHYCANGQCVSKNAVCDRIADCEDKSDEYKCVYKPKPTVATNKIHEAEYEVEEGGTHWAIILISCAGSIFGCCCCCYCCYKCCADVDNDNDKTTGETSANPAASGVAGYDPTVQMGPAATATQVGSSDNMELGPILPTAGYDPSSSQNPTGYRPPMGPQIAYPSGCGAIDYPAPDSAPGQAYPVPSYQPFPSAPPEDQCTAPPTQPPPSYFDAMNI